METSGKGAASVQCKAWCKTWLARVRNVTAIQKWWSETLFTRPADARSCAEGRFFDSWPALGLLAVMAAALLFFNLSYQLIEPDETRYSHVAAEMVRTGDYLVPRRLGQLHLNKPPLFYWLAAASIQLLGPHEIAARLPSALAGLATVLAVYLMGKRIFPARAAWIGAALLLFCNGYMLSARFAITDCLLTLCTTLAAMAGLLAIRGERLAGWWWLLAAAACGAGILTKGPVALVLFAPPIVAYGWLTPAAARVKLWHWVCLIAVALAIAGPWYVLIWEVEPDFARHFFLKNNLQRYVNTFNHSEPFWFYLPVLILLMLPTSLLLPALGAFLLSRRAELRSQRSWDLGYLLLCSTWTFGFFSLASGKLPTYILPLMPPLGLALGCTFHAGVLQPTGNWLFKWLANWGPRQTALMFAGCLSVVAGVQIYFANRAILFDCALLGAGLACYVALLFPRTVYACQWGVALGLGWAVWLYGYNRVYPTIASQRSYIQHAVALADDKGVNGGCGPVAFYVSSSEGAEFSIAAAQLRQFAEGQEHQLVKLIRAHGQLTIVSAPHNANELQCHLPAGIEVVHTDCRGWVHLAEVRRKETPDPQAVLIADRRTVERR